MYMISYVASIGLGGEALRASLAESLVLELSLGGAGNFYEYNALVAAAVVRGKNERRIMFAFVSPIALKCSTSSLGEA